MHCLSTLGRFHSGICGFSNGVRLHVRLFAYDLRFLSESVCSDFQTLAGVAACLLCFVVENLCFHLQLISLRVGPVLDLGTALLRILAQLVILLLFWGALACDQQKDDAKNG
jgi:hypothetical protein